VTLISDETSVENSVQFLKDMEQALKTLPKDDLNGVAKAKTFKNKLQKGVDGLANFFAFASQYEIDEKNVKKLIENLQKSSEILNDMISYMNLVIKTHESIDSLKSSPKWTFEELQEKLN
jgi:hypothetical protein